MDPIFSALQIDINRTRALLPPALAGLADTAWNLAWSWLPDGAATFREIDPEVWESSGHNARALLEAVSAERLQELAADPAFRERAGRLESAFRAYLAQPPAAGAEPLISRYGGRPTAYFSAEFGLHESLPVYSGGLGILAGDHLKSASDVGVPLVGVGLRYRQGYFQQGLDPSGWQTEAYSDIDFGRLSTGLVLAEDGTPLTIKLPIGNRMLTLQMWGVMVGRVPLILLDSNRDDNDPIDRWISAHLYGGDRDTRIAQEMALGIGGVRALRALGYDPAVFHMNEGHAAFLALELLREGLDRGESWDGAMAATRRQTVFTTHTPVKAGHDAFSTDQVNAFMTDYYREFREGGAELSHEKLLALGRKYAEDPYEEFGMTHLAMHASRSINGVSRLHGEVCREMWQWLWPDKTKDETPIGHVTNGIHAQSWIAPPLRALLDRYLGKGWERRQDDPRAWDSVDDIPDAELWAVHCGLKEEMVQHVRASTRALRESLGESPEYIEAAAELLSPDALTFGFARRVATYKRLSLLLHDPERALNLLDLPGRPVQFVIAGKAHPHDSEAKRVLQHLFQVRKDPRVMKRATFVVNYNIAVARPLVQGVDVWLNVPRRPLEASGTSGMKAALNGIPNCSILDGWWAEGYNGKNGWALGKEQEYTDANQQDDEDADSLYRTIEEQIVPLYFDRDADGVPHKWVALMKETLKSAGPVFNTERMVSEYVRKVYAPEM